MKSRLGNLSIASYAASLTIITLFFLSTGASAQVGQGAKVQMQEMTKRELQLSDLSKGNNKEADPKRAQAIREQLSEDFSRILKLHNDIVRTIGDKSPLDYQFISNASGEINKRAVRLQATLALGAAADQSELNRPNADDAPDVLGTDGLIKLCRKIELFVKNPIIETPGIVDAQQLESARRDLQSIIELSGAIKKVAAKQKRGH